MFKEDAELVRKLAREHLHSAFDPLPDNKLNFSIIKGKKLEEVTVGDVALMLKKAGLIPTLDRDKINLLLNNQTIIPKNQGMKNIRELFESLSLGVTFSNRFLDIFRKETIAISMHIGLKNSLTPKVISIKGKLNKDW